MALGLLLRIFCSEATAVTSTDVLWFVLLPLCWWLQHFVPQKPVLCKLVTEVVVGSGLERGCPSLGHRSVSHGLCFSGLGKNSEGRVEPVQAVVLPRGKSLDQCAEVLQKKKQGRLDPGNSKKCRAKGNNTGRASAGSRKPPRNVFDFLNEKLRGKSSGEKAGGVALPERNSKEIYHASKSTKKALSVRLFQTMEKIEQTQKDIRGIQQALARNIGR